MCWFELVTCTSHDAACLLFTNQHSPELVDYTAQQIYGEVTRPFSLPPLIRTETAGWLQETNNTLSLIVGHGFKLAPVVGKILSELTMDLPPSYDLQPFKLDPFRTS